MATNPNAASLSRSNRFLRQVDVADPAKFVDRVTVIGAGALGSAASIGIAKAGCPGINLVDPDTIEEHNQANQFCLDKLGQPKVASVAELIALTTSMVVNQVQMWVTPDGLLPPDKAGSPQPYPGDLFSGIVIATPDSMAARKMIWDKVRFNPKVRLLIDARATIHYLQIITADPTNREDIKRYESTLVTDAEATPEPCGARGIAYASMFAGAHLTNIYVAFQTGRRIPQEIRHSLQYGGLTQTFNGKESTNEIELAESLV